MTLVSIGIATTSSDASAPVHTSLAPTRATIYEPSTSQASSISLPPRSGCAECRSGLVTHGMLPDPDGFIHCIVPVTAGTAWLTVRSPGYEEKE